MPVLVHTHGVAVSEPEQLGDAVGVDQVVGVYGAVRVLSRLYTSGWRR